MNLVIGIVFMATLMGLFVPRWQARHWVFLGGWVILMVVVSYFKGR
ncbi:hypothetical protein [Armatimonas sp.]|nr:hypothetical protein [Armatimonas sp.]